MRSHWFGKPKVTRRGNGLILFHTYSSLMAHPPSSIAMVERMSQVLLRALRRPACQTTTTEPPGASSGSRVSMIRIHQRGYSASGMPP